MLPYPCQSFKNRILAFKADYGSGPLQALAGAADVQVMVAPLGKAFYGDVRSKRMVSPLKRLRVHATEALLGCVCESVRCCIDHVCNLENNYLFWCGLKTRS
jgi:hypothetical protein